MNNETMNKEKWVSMFREIGLDDAKMEKWHTVFETRYPAEHQRFLEWLRIPSDEIREIRAR